MKPGKTACQWHHHFLPGSAVKLRSIRVIVSFSQKMSATYRSLAFYNSPVFDQAGGGRHEMNIENENSYDLQ